MAPKAAPPAEPPAPPPEPEDPDEGKREIVFHLEVPCASGLPRAERTLVQLSGFGIDGAVTSQPLPDDVEPATTASGWLFPSLEAVKAEKAAAAAAAAAAADPKAKGKGAPPPVPDGPPPPEPEPVFRLPLLCGSARSQRRTLDFVCGSPLTVTLLRQSPDGATMPLGVAKLHCQDLVHSVASVEADVALQWSPELLAELKQEFDTAAEAAAAEAAAAAAAEAEAAAGDEATQEGVEPPPAPEPAPLPLFDPPPLGSVHVKVSTSGPIGRVLCPEDLDDWTVLSLEVDGCYQVPEKLVNAGGAVKEGDSGIISEHPLNYSVRVLGLELKGGQLFIPDVPPPPEPPAEEAGAEAGGAAAGEAPGEAAADGTIAEPMAQQSPSGSIAGSAGGATPAGGFGPGVGREEFVEGLVRTSLVTAHEDGPALFDLLAGQKQTTISLQDFAQLEHRLGARPADAKTLLEFRGFLCEQCSDLHEAYGSLDTEGNAAVSSSAFKEALTGLEFPGVETSADSIFSALNPGDGLLARENLLALNVYKRLDDLRALEKAAQWLLAGCGSISELLMQVDSAKTGKITAEMWEEALEKLAHPQMDPAKQLFDYVNMEGLEEVEPSVFGRLEGIDVPEVERVLPQFLQLLNAQGDDAGNDAEVALAVLGNYAASGTIVSTLSRADFAASCEALAWKFKAEPGALAWLLSESGSVTVEDLSALIAYVNSARSARLATCKAFLLDTFGSVEAAFRMLFDDNTEFFKTAEETKPCIKWPNSTVSGYRGREFLQQLLNTLRDKRGRMLGADGDAKARGTWLYMFPCLKDQKRPIDFKDAGVQAAGQGPNMQIARWHHGQAFLDLRRLTAPPSSGSAAEVEFRIFLSQVERQPADVNEAGELASAPFGLARTYVKGKIKLDRSLSRLCPRDIPPLPTTSEETGGGPLLPPAPEEKPPPSCSEELEQEASIIVGKLAGEFARLCQEQGLSETQIVGHGGETGAHLLLGRKAEKGTLAPWMRGQEGGATYRDLAMQLRPAIVRLVRSEAREGPSCGLNGNEKDAMYTGIRDMLLQHLFRSLNHDVESQRRSRDARLWKSPGDAETSERPDEAKAQDAKKEEERDGELSRLVFEYELLGDDEYATQLFKERLDLPKNALNSDAWYSFARFFMRCGQERQLEAEENLRYGMSVRPAPGGPTLLDVAFLACMMMNKGAACSLVDPSARFDAACSLLSTYVDDHPTERMGYLFLFVVYAVEAHEVGLMAAELVKRRGADPNVVAEAATRHERLAAEARKHLELARKSEGFFVGSLGGPPGDSSEKSSFPELERLLQQERQNRGEAPPAPGSKPEAPEAWQTESQPIFESYDAVHKQPSPEDSLALECIDTMLHFGIPTFVELLVRDAAETYGFLTPTTVASERCQLQLIRAAMLQKDWAHAEELIGGLFAITDRIQEAHALLGECRFQAVKEAAKLQGPPRASAYGPALDAFKASLNFATFAANSEASKQEDPVAHLRVASIYFRHAQESDFQDEAATAAALESLKQSLLVAPTAEAWCCAGICSYQEACLRRQRLRASAASGDAGAGTSGTGPVAAAALAPEALFGEAVRFLTEANTLDRRRPQINAWLTICAAELGRISIAKQTFRQVLRYSSQLDVHTALQLSTTLLRFSDERQALPGERPKYTEDGRYASEAGEAAKIALQLQESGQGHFLLGRSLALQRKDLEALLEFQQTLQGSQGDERRLQEAAGEARALAKKLAATDPTIVAAVEQDIKTALATAAEPDF
eukprot:TRINITY_DN80284_c0_g1_i1.p1 TRINITY_DN80284_c0_g1~~TRINITY_DN80284_c0_g1_i1.p1  ORF type:complete len:1784 (+),score=584.59 TRINITY_DN80284_c0_g1_i1:72-5354(+)